VVLLTLADLLKNYLFSTIDISQDMPDKFIDKLDEQWPKEKVQKDKQRSTKHCAESKRLSNTNPAKN
jgi:hypothetical protein